MWHVSQAVKAGILGLSSPCHGPTCLGHGGASLGEDFSAHLPRGVQKPEGWEEPGPVTAVRGDRQCGYLQPKRRGEVRRHVTLESSSPIASALISHSSHAHVRMHARTHTHTPGCYCLLPRESVFGKTRTDIVPSRHQPLVASLTLLTFPSCFSLVGTTCARSPVSCTFLSSESELHFQS